MFAVLKTTLSVNEFMILKQVEDVDENTQWGQDCPRACTCKNTAFTDLPIVKWMNNGINSEPEPQTFYTQNEVIIKL